MVRVKIGTKVRARRDFPIYWLINNKFIKVADIVEGTVGVVVGYEFKSPVVSIDDPCLLCVLDRFSYHWQFVFAGEKDGSDV